jgi:ABC-type multidrug transport system ATPase subunit
METRNIIASMTKVGFAFKSSQTSLLNDVSLEINSGEVVMLAGANGSGKTSVLGLLSGQLKPCSGKVVVFGTDPCIAKRAPSLGLVTEPFHPTQSPVPVDFTIREIIAWLEILDNLEATDIYPLLAQLELKESLLGRRVFTLSKGERQRVALLTVLARQPQLVLADEPLDGLDQKTRQIMGQCLGNYAKSDGRSVFWVSHHLAETLQYADRLLEIENCKIIESPEERYAIRISMPNGDLKEEQVNTLAAIPGLVQTHIETRGTLHLEINDETNVEASR